MRITVERCDEVTKTYHGVHDVFVEATTGMLVLKDSLGQAIVWVSRYSWTRVSFDYGEG